MSKNYINFNFGRSLNNIMSEDNLSTPPSSIQNFLSKEFKEIADEKSFKALTQLLEKHKDEIKEVQSLPSLSEPRLTQTVRVEFINGGAEVFAEEAIELGLNPQP